MTTPNIIELCAGTAAVSLAALGARFPVSRIGSKSGYAHAVHEALGVVECRRVLLVEQDARLANLLVALCCPVRRAILYAGVKHAAEQPSARDVWERARVGESALDHLIWMAGARGGIGGFKGGHVRRPSVDGFIPSLPSLAKRLREFNLSGTVEVTAVCLTTLDPRAYAPCAVYVDPPYVGRQGYRCALPVPVTEVAEQWANAGHRVIVSEARPLDGCDEVRNITLARRGQKRVSLTHDAEEWLSIWRPRTTVTR